MKRAYGGRKMSRHLEKRGLQEMSGAKSRYLICYPPKIRPKFESSQISQNHFCKVSLH